MQKFNGSLVRQFPSLVTGNAASGVSVTVYTGATGTNLATLFSGNGTGSLSNPLTTDAAGYYGFYAADGVYRLSFGVSTIPDQLIQLVDVDAIRSEFDAISGEFDALEADNAAFKVEQQTNYDNFVLAAGWDAIGTFAAGFTYTQANQVGVDGDGNWWRWAGALPKVVAAATNPTSDANYKIVSDAGLRQEIAATDSSVLVGGVEAGSIGELLSVQAVDGQGVIRYDTTLVVGSNPQPSLDALRDSYQVLRDLVGLTNCHGYADRSVLKNVTDIGQYGTFDSVVRVEGSHTHDHVYSFQDRVDYGGSGVLTNTAGLYSVFKHSGTGNVVTRVGAEIRNANITAGGTITNQFGLRVRALTGATFNTGVQIELADATGNLSLVSSGTAKGLHVGQFGFGGLNTDNVAITFRNQVVSSSVKGFLDTTATQVRFGALSDVPVQLLTGGGIRWQFLGSAGSYSLTPNVSNLYDIGTASLLVRSVYSSRVVKTGGTVWTSGAGTPEGALAAPVGSMYTRTDGGAGTTLYVKETGTGNTGWVAK